MDQCIDFLKNELVHIRVGRADARLLDRVMVDYYGVPTPINQMATVQVSEARQLLITPWDQSVLKEIERSLINSDLGITPQNDGKAIRLNFPMLTEERRRDLGKDVQKLGEEAKIALRNVRRDFLDEMKKLLKNSEIGEDHYHDAEREIQKIIDKKTQDVDQLVKEKEKDLLEI
ncbi:MAG: ribosome recycling factor [Eubacteriales bacterium]|nr:ribosome recycling factor [Eubacteriales bacterium]